jgi:hypothetical protein
MTKFRSNGQLNERTAISQTVQPVEAINQSASQRGRANVNVSAIRNATPNRQTSMRTSGAVRLIGRSHAELIMSRESWRRLEIMISSNEWRGKSVDQGNVYHAYAANSDMNQAMMMQRAELQPMSCARTIQLLSR